MGISGAGAVLRRVDWPQCGHGMVSPMVAAGNSRWPPQFRQEPFAMTVVASSGSGEAVCETAGIIGRGGSGIEEGSFAAGAGMGVGFGTTGAGGMTGGMGGGVTGIGLSGAMGFGVSRFVTVGSGWVGAAGFSVGAGLEMTNGVGSGAWGWASFCSREASRVASRFISV